MESAEIPGELRRQIEAAYDFRGHVTIKFKSGESVEGFLFNRQFENPRLPEDRFVEVFLKGAAEKRRYKMSAIESIVLTGEDFAS